MREPIGHRIYDVNNLQILILVDKFLALGMWKDWP